MSLNNFLRVSVCVCTYKRPEMLTELIRSLAQQEYPDSAFEIIVVDNDRNESAKVAIDSVRESYPKLCITYEVETRQGISFARNKSVSLAKGEFLAFIDDDEWACPNWLMDLINTQIKYKADAVLGPVLPVFSENTAAWVIKSRFFERPRYLTGTKLTSDDGRAGNALVRAGMARLRGPQMFDERFSHSGGEDHDFFRWFEAQGGQIIWCDSAVVSEVVPLSRQTLGFMLERKMRSSMTYWRGVNSRRPYLFALAEALFGFIGALVYFSIGVLVLPFGRHKAVAAWIKSAAGLGRVMALTKLRMVGYGEQNG